MHELVDEHLDALRVVSEHGGRRFQPRDIAMVVGTEHVDRAVEAALELVPHVGDVCREVQVRAVRGTEERAVLVVAVGGRSRPERSLRFVRVERREQLCHLGLDLGLAAPRVDRNPKLGHLAADLVEHGVDRVARLARDLLQILADVTALGRWFAAPARLD